MKPPRILIFTSAHLCRNPRVVKEATTLGAAGFDVTVLTVSTHERFERFDRELLRGAPFRRVTLDYSLNSWRMRTADIAQRTSTWLARKLNRHLHIESPQALGPAHALLARALREPADLTIVHTEIPIWAACSLIREGRRVAVDVEDWYSEDLLYRDRLARPLRLLRDSEAFSLRNAVYSSATSQSMADALTRSLACPPPIVIRNTFPLQAKSRLDRPTDGKPPRFIWFSQTVGPGRGLELFLAAWSRTRQPSQLYLLGDERPGYRDKLMELLPAHRRSDLRFLPIVTPAQLPVRLAEFDLGLALEPRWPLNRDVTISNKIFQYMNAGLAVVATTTAGQREVMEAAPDCGLLVKANHTTALAAQLDEVLASPARLRAMQQASRRAAEQMFCWEREEPRLIAAVNQALRPS
ncbi:MAG: glycosyltransferase [Candidatus Didemnitutus sp.]|nr:glycosyltransferase [Candidatus Didemnitutus sp.]